MTNRYVRPVGLVVGVVVVAAVYYGVVLDVSHGAGLRWRPVSEGVVTGAAVLAVWNLVRTREAAALGLGLAVVVVVAGLAEFWAAVPFAHSPLGWATVLGLLARLVAPDTAGHAERRRQPAERQHPG